MQWSVNEQCVQYSECNTFRPFIDAGKPVFHIEYPKSAPSVSVSQKDSFCGNQDADGFSSVLTMLTPLVSYCSLAVACNSQISSTCCANSSQSSMLGCSQFLLR